MADILFRYQRMLLSLLGLLTVGFAAYALLKPRLWDAEMTIAVLNNPPLETQLNTEVQLLRSTELAAQVVDKAQLGGATPDGRQKAITELKRNLEVTPIEKSNLIRIHYSSIAQARSQRVLEFLSAAFLERHQALKPADAVAFLAEQTAATNHQLVDTQQQLLQFHKTNGVTDAAAEKNLYLQKIVELRGETQKAETENAETVRRVDELKARLEHIPERVATGTKQIPNQFSVERLNVLLTELRNRRTELQAARPPVPTQNDDQVKALDLQIADTSKALDAAERTSANEETTGANPVRQSLEKDLEHAQTAAAGLQERMLELRAQIDGTQRELSRMESLIPAEQNFLRGEKAANEKYLLYSRKLEQSRIDGMMDQHKAPTVTLFDSPRAANSPRPRFNPKLLATYFAGWLLALLAVFVRNQRRRSAFTPWVLDGMTSLRVLGTVPARAGSLASRRRL